jgi:hypothetical protein
MLLHCVLRFRAADVPTLAKIIQGYFAADIALSDGIE